MPAEKVSLNVQRTSTGLLVPIFDSDDDDEQVVELNQGSGKRINVIEERVDDYRDEEAEEEERQMSRTTRSSVAELYGSDDDEGVANAAFFGELKGKQQQQSSSSSSKRAGNERKASAQDWDVKSGSRAASLKPASGIQSFQTTLQEKIQERLLLKIEQKSQSDDNGNGVDVDDDNDNEDDRSEAPPVSQKDTLQRDRVEIKSADAAREERRRRKEAAKREYFGDGLNVDVAEVHSFADMNLSRPLLRAVNDLGFVQPTPIQQQVVPIGLLGRDVCGSAVTGSGKTAAFMLPILERLLYRSKRVTATRVLVLLPTRELAAQCHSMTTALAKYTDVRVALVVGGLSSKVQEAELRRRPDIVIGTPGRVIDHVLNTQSVGLESVEILVLDEADRLLDMGFADELSELVGACPRERQTMLLSATMTDAVDRLARLSLKNPARVEIGAKYGVASELAQEFVRVRPAREADREAMLLALLTRTYAKRTIVFVGSKRAAHRLCIVLGLMQLRAAELHGNLTQAQRLDALAQFQRGDVDFLIATDLASRGLDVRGVETVVNLHLPAKHKSYVHRVGRTARAGRRGRACSFVGEADRPLLRQIVRQMRTPSQSRTIPPAVIAHWRQRIDGAADDIAAIAGQERLERELRIAEQGRAKLENMIVHEGEIYARPARQWFQSAAEKLEAKQRSLHATVSSSGTAAAAAAAAERKKQEADAATRREAKSESRRLRRAAKRDAARAAERTDEQVEFDREQIVEQTQAYISKRELRRAAQLRGVTPAKMALILEQQRAAKEANSGAAKPKRKRQRTAASSPSDANVDWNDPNTGAALLDIDVDDIVLPKRKFASGTHNRKRRIGGTAFKSKKRYSRKR
jgi:ATP-dependent RNA helicase DDX27